MATVFDSLVDLILSNNVDWVEWAQERDLRPMELRVLDFCAHSERLTDPPYYRLLFALAAGAAVEGAGIRAVEIGTNKAVGTAHLAYPGKSLEDKGVVVTLDINPDATQNAADLEYSNIVAINHASTDPSSIVDHVGKYGPFDLLFIDGNHTFNQAYSEYLLYRQHVREGGVILFDDITLDMSTKEMHALWEVIPEPKVALPLLHDTGFGLVRRTNKVKPTHWRSALDNAKRWARNNGGVWP